MAASFTGGVFVSGEFLICNKNFLSYMIRVPERRQHNHLLATCTVFPRSNTAATNFFLLLKLAAIIQGQRLLKGGDKNYYCIYDNMNNEKFCSKFKQQLCLLSFRHPPLLLA